MDKLELTDELFIAKGTQKAVYHHPNDKDKCVKVKIIEKNDDMNKELKYRQSLQRRNLHLSMLPEYYGTVETNLGIGYVFEYIRDFDGNRSYEINEYLDNPQMIEDKLGMNVSSLMFLFKEIYFKEKPVLSNVELCNFLVQRTKTGENKIRVVDNLGTPVAIPLVYYFDYFLNRRTRKYWNILVGVLEKSYLDLVTKKLLADLRV